MTALNMADLSKRSQLQNGAPQNGRGGSAGSTCLTGRERAALTPHPPDIYILHVMFVLMFMVVGVTHNLHQLPDVWGISIGKAREETVARPLIFAK